MGKGDMRGKKITVLSKSGRSNYSKIDWPKRNSSKCVWDSDGDGNCHLCYKKGGCRTPYFKAKK